MTSSQQVTLRDVVHSGITLGIGMSKTLDIARELGFAVRDMEFARQWREEQEAFRQWRREQNPES